jgi:hypothetical protein
MERGNEGQNSVTVVVNVSDPHSEEIILNYITAPSQIKEKPDLGENEDSCD